MKQKLVQHNGLTHKAEKVILPKGNKTLEEWRDTFNEHCPPHITYVVEGTK